ncbi:unnamed protein product [Rangifer tarandus platyrhynchus]|uniref:Uncharacterized protein n=1 Tax=Rangifer tarandus platyrhynchus TaxID=3082113 RepID=A0AC59YZ22_RANTA
MRTTLGKPVNDKGPIDTCAENILGQPGILARLPSEEAEYQPSENLHQSSSRLHLAHHHEHKTSLECCSHTSACTQRTRKRG